MTASLPLIKNWLTPLAKNAFIPLALRTAMPATDAALQKEIYGSGTTVLIMPNEEMEDVMKIVKSLEESRLSIKGISETIKNETKEQKDGFLGILLDPLATSLLRSVLTGRVAIRADEGTIRAGQNF